MTAKKIILGYIALRPVLATMYNINIAGGFNVLEISGLLFPVFLFGYWAVKNFPIENRNLTLFFMLVILWVAFSGLITSFNDRHIYDFASLAPLVRILNGFAVFLVFPLVFKTREDFRQLLLVFIIGSIFPLLQGTLQALGISLGGLLQSSASRHETYATKYIIYYGMYYKNDGYIMASLFGSLAAMFFIFYNRKNKEQTPMILYVLLSFYFIVATLTLGRTLFFILFLLYVGLFHKYIIRPYGLIILGIVTVIALMTPYVQDRYDSIMTRSQQEFGSLSGERKSREAFNGRMGLWQRKLAIYAKKPILEKLVGSGTIRIGKHSDYVSWYLAYGIIGFLFYILLWSWLLIRALRLYLLSKSYGNPFYASAALLAIFSIAAWILTAVTFNPSNYPDYAYFILGTTAITFSLGKQHFGKNNISRPDSTSFYGPEHSHRNYFTI
ncbi:MAG: O-antigen ligase family protein [Deferribacteres bacterium]|nr:O-antigen ligase family protein [Deferribacteres bacterium]